MITALIVGAVLLVIIVSINYTTQNQIRYQAELISRLHADDGKLRADFLNQLREINASLNAHMRLEDAHTRTEVPMWAYEDD